MRIRAYLMLELLVVLVITSMMLMLYLPSVKEVNYDDYLFASNYLLTQSKSMVEKESHILENNFKFNINYPIIFNRDGNINQAQTINANYHNIIIHLGNGYLTYE